MEIGRFLLAIVLTVAVIVITNLLFPPAPRPTSVPAATDSAAVRPDTLPAQDPDAAPPRAAPETEPVTPAQNGDTVFVRSPLYRFGFSTAGARLVSASLLRYASFTGNGPVQLVPDGLSLFGVRLAIEGRTIDLSDVVFEPSQTGELQLPDNGVVELAFRASADGVPLEITYRLRGDSYLIDVEGRAGAGQGARILFDLGPTLAVNEANAAEDHRALAYVVNGRRQGIQSVRLDKVEGQQIEEGPLTWVALKNKYFLAALLAPADRPFGGLIAGDVPEEHAAQLTATMPVAGEQAFAVQLYVGPQEAERLAAIGNGLQDVNPYGWRIFRPIIRPLAHLITWALTALHNVLGIGYGWVLILFGVLVRLVLWPLNAKAGRAQLKNMEVQPRLKEIQTKYRADPERLQKEMMRLYKEEGFNPLGGCLPLLIPFPVLITLFFVFQGTIEFRGVDFLWLPDLSRKDPLYVLPVLLGASMFVMQWISVKSLPDPNPQMKMMMWFMPIFMVVIFLNLASGLNLYYLASNMASIPQQIQLRNERLRAQAKRRS